MFICVVCFAFIALARGSLIVRTEDVFVPNPCESIAQETDHLLLEYAVIFANGTHGQSIGSTEQLFHIQLESTDVMNLHKGLKGMCVNATRRLYWDDAANANFQPIMLSSSFKELDDEDISIQVTLHRITPQIDYQIFDALKIQNISKVLDIIDEQHGVNAVDEWGQSPLMLAVSNQYMPVIAALLNARRPKVDVNLAKPSGFTALFYAVEKSSVTIVQALLRRGADPNISARQEGSRGNTPLHFACMLEKVKHAEALLQYGADPIAVNEHGQTPLQVLPRDAVRSTKVYLKKIFEEAFSKQQALKIQPSASSEL